jgi:YVTN family beta-propeller protein
MDMLMRVSGNRSLPAGITIMVLALTVAPAIGADASFRVFVTNEGSGDLTVIDGRRREVIATIPLGKRPRGITADARGNRLFVALSGSPLAGPGIEESTLPPADKDADGIGVVDTRTLTLDRVLRGVSDPEQVAVSGDGRRLYVASEDTGKGVAIDIATGAVLAQLSVGGEPEGVTVHPNRSIAYFTSETGNSISLVDTAKLQVLQTIQVGQRPRDVAVSRDGSRTYVTGETDASLTVIDGQSGAVFRRLKVPGDGARPKGVVVSRDGRRIFVSTGRGGEIVAFDASTLKVLGSVRVGARPWGLALSPDDRYIYAADGPSDEVSVVATDKMQVEATIKVGKRPWGVVVVPDGSR